MNWLIETTLILGGLCAILLIFVEWRLRGHPLHVASRMIPGERIWPLIGNMIEVIDIRNNGENFVKINVKISSFLLCLQRTRFSTYCGKH